MLLQRSSLRTSSVLSPLTLFSRPLRSCRYCSGESSWTGSNQYTDCEAGYYCPGDDTYDCYAVDGTGYPKIECPAGTWSGAGQGSCTGCTAGRYSSIERATNDGVCQLCGTGERSATGAPKCIDSALESLFTSEIRAAVNAAAAGAVTSWEAGTGVLAQTFSVVKGWGWEDNEFFNSKAGTLQCTDVVTKCTIDAQASSSDERRVLSVKNADFDIAWDGSFLGDGVFLIGLVIRGGYMVC
jgi:hypothetical protein